MKKKDEKKKKKKNGERQRKDCRFWDLYNEHVAWGKKYIYLYTFKHAPILLKKEF